MPVNVLFALQEETEGVKQEFKGNKMINEHHDLIHEFAEHRERIHEMKMNDERFSRLFNEYHEVTKTVEKMEAEIEPVCTQTEEEAKFKRLKLKDELYAMLQG